MGIIFAWHYQVVRAVVVVVCRRGALSEILIIIVK